MLCNYHLNASQNPLTMRGITVFNKDQEGQSSILTIWAWLMLLTSSKSMDMQKYLPDCSQNLEVILKINKVN